MDARLEGLYWIEPVELDNGVVVNFWIIRKVLINSFEGTAEVSYEGYLDQATFESGKNKILEKSKVIDFTGFDPEGAQTSRIIQAIRQ